MTGFLWALPWVALLIFVRFVARFPRELPGTDAGPTGVGWPSVSVIVPARNERLNIGTCVASLVASEYPDFEVIVVDDRSDDETAALAEAVGQGHARRVLVVQGEPLPDGWLGKPWACRQGFDRAEGDLLLFTDADTTHGPELLRRAVLGLYEERADLLTVLGRQLMESFWERLVQPHIFMMMLFRFPSFERAARSRSWRAAIANGQFLLFTRAAYEAINGHDGVRDEVVEDLVLAQRVKRAGLALRIRSAEDDLSTRMYRSLRELVAGWTKNVAMGGAQSYPPAVRWGLAPTALVSMLLLWLAPPVTLVVSMLAPGWADSSVRIWAATATLSSVVTFGWFSHRVRSHAAYGALYPLGVLVSAFILARSWLRGRRVEWKGRRYVLPPASERA